MTRIEAIEALIDLVAGSDRNSVAKETYLDTATYLLAENKRMKEALEAVLGCAQALDPEMTAAYALARTALKGTQS